MATKKNNKNRQMPTFSFTWVYVIILVVLAYFFFTGNGERLTADTRKEVNYTEFQDYVRKGYGKTLVANKDRGEASLELLPEHYRDVFPETTDFKGTKPSVVTQYPSVDKLDDFIDVERAAGTFTGDVRYEHEAESPWWGFLLNLGPMFLLIFLDIHHAPHEWRQQRQR